MPVVSNTSPILNLAIIHQLDLLRQQFGEILIPPAVQAELKPGIDLPGADEIQRALEDGWLRVTALNNTDLEQALALELDRGEAAAIALAREVNADFIVMDESDGRIRAAALGLRPVGVLGVLLRAKRADQIASVREAVITLRRDAGFFIADDRLAAVLREAGEGE